MNTTPKHTPEWMTAPTAGHDTHGQSAIYGENGKTIALVYDGDKHAAHIVRCVNGFDGLVEALKLAQATIDRLTVKHPGGFSSTQGSLDVIAAALKAVDEG